MVVELLVVVGVVDELRVVLGFVVAVVVVVLVIKVELVVALAVVKNLVVFSRGIHVDLGVAGVKYFGDVVATLVVNML